MPLDDLVKIKAAVKENKVLLDRDINDLKLPAIPTMPYAIEVKVPYRVHENDEKIINTKVNTGFPKIHILDDCREQQRSPEFIASHMKLVSMCIDESKYDVYRYHVGSDSHIGKLDHLKTDEAARYLAMSFPKEPQVLLYAASDDISIKDLNILIKNLSGVSENITRNNIGEKSDKIRECLKNNLSKLSKSDRDKYESLLKLTDNFENMSKSNWVIAVGAGNHGPDVVNLIGVLAPSVIVGGGIIEQKYSEGSANNSSVDAYEQYKLSIEVQNIGKIFKLEGTSYSAPRLIPKIVELQAKGLKAKEINEYLRSELKK